MGAILLIIGSYIMTEESRVTGIASTTLPTIIVSLGAIITLIAFLGCYGASRLRIPLIRMYISILLVCVLVQIGMWVVWVDGVCSGGCYWGGTKGSC
jgi:ABC-type nickel/cobalt efflux system permease component RcnA